MLSDCPIANSYAPEISRIVADYAARGVRSYVVYVEDDLSAATARQHAQDHEFKFPALCGVKVPVSVILIVSGGFMLFEAVRGWCVMRTCGIKTKL